MPGVLGLYPDVAVKSGPPGDTSGFTLRHSFSAVQFWAVLIFFPVTELWTVGCTPLRFAVSHVTVTGLGVESKIQ